MVLYGLMLLFRLQSSGYGPKGILPPGRDTLTTHYFDLLSIIIIMGNSLFVYLKTFQPGAA